MEKQKIGILSLGCPRNLVDSESILGRLNLKGYPVVDMDKADIAIVNTCAFIEEAKTESIDAILGLADLKKQGKLKKIIVYGCLSQRYKDKISREIPEIDALVGRVSLNHGSARFPITPGHFAYLKICEGCINRCSYCAIPNIKQEFSSLGLAAVLKKAEQLDKAKISEINIIGQDITGYGLGRYAKTRLPDLLRALLAKIKHIGWVRLLYLYPSRVSEELLTLVRDEPKLCKYIDLPLQHINDRILKLMNRHTTKKEILKLIEKIRRYIPGAAIRTSLIVGFPSESEEEFGELLDFVREVKFERLGAFIYSREEDTPAYHFRGQVPKKTRLSRLDALMELQQEISRENNAKFLGKDITALIDNQENGLYLGRSQYDAPEVDGLLYVKSAKKLEAGKFVKVKITDTYEYDLVGEVN